MLRIILHGCNGVMGQNVVKAAASDPEVGIVAGIDIVTDRKNDFPVYRSLSECKEEADVVIDFAAAPAMDGLISALMEKKLPVVMCTTGLSEAQLSRVKELSEQTAVLRSANMSLGINTLTKVLKQITPVLAAAGFDMEILEMHHNRKVDAPSGTALALAQTMNEALDNSYEFKLDRSAERKKRSKHEIGIQALRGGTVPGVHEVYFAGEDEVIKLSHTCYSRAVFAEGAIAAAKFLAGKPAGMYDMQDVIG
jgi:4-hydroxy-tetrahydrodipicolinate reductase